MARVGAGGGDVSLLRRLFGDILFRLSASRRMVGSDYQRRFVRVGGGLRRAAK